MVSNPLSSNNPYSPSHTPAAAPEPNEPPPAYAQATGQQQGAGGYSGHRHTASLEVPGNPRRASSDYTASDEEHEDVIPANERAAADALTDERPLPKGWSREYDVNSGHVFFVDTQANPPRSIWTHPLDPQYIASLPLDQQPQYMAAKTKHDDPHAPTGADGPHGAHDPLRGSSSRTPASTSQQPAQPEKRTLGRKLKDKLTNSTHEQRVQERKAQAEAERKRYLEYQKRRQALQSAVSSGQYQPRFAAPTGAYTYGGPYGGGGFGGLGGGYGTRYGGGYDVYGSSYDRYGYPNARYAPGGMAGMGRSRAGMGTGMALGGGLLGGLLIGDLLF